MDRRGGYNNNNYRQNFNRGGDRGARGADRGAVEERVNLAKRPVLNYAQESKPIMLTTNYLKVDLMKEIQDIYLIKVEFSPAIEADNRVLREKLILSCKDQIDGLLGNHYIVHISQIFTTYQPSFVRQKKVVIKTEFQKQDYQLQLKIVKTFKAEDLNNENSKKNQVPLIFFNVIMKDMLKNMNFFEFGKNTKYFEPSAEYHQKIEGTNLMVYKGWNTPFENCKEGLLLKLELTHKVARNENALNYINLIYKNSVSQDKDNKRKEVRQKLKDQSVMANYGNFKQFQICDVIFDKNCKVLKMSDSIQDSSHPAPEIVYDSRGKPVAQPKLSQKEIEDQNLSVYDYYVKKYGLKIKFEKQPLLLVFEKKVQKYLFFVPELCVLTGVPDEISDFQRKEIINATKQSPSEVYNMVTELISRLISPNCNEHLSNKRLSEQLGITFQQQTLNLKAKQINHPTITFGAAKKEAPREVLDDNIAVQFQMKYPIYNNAESSMSVALIYFEGFNASELQANWCTISKDMNIEVKKPVEFNLGEFTNSSLEDIQNIISREIQKDKFDIVAIVAPNKLCSIETYSKIKKFCTVDQQIKSQFIRQSSLENQQQAYTISAAILTQMAAKCGASVWVASPPNGLPEKIMMVGTSIQKVFVEGVCQYVIGFVASQDKNQTKFFSKAVFQKGNKESIEQIKGLFVDALKQYFNNNKYVPEHIVYMRENIADDLIHKFLVSEIKEVLNSFSELSAQYKPNLCVILLESRNGVKCFKKSETDPTDIQNPESGTIIDNVITSKFNYDFYMISQNVTQGTSAPVHYKIVYDTTNFPEGKLQELLYSQCFNYVNWSGVIKYPSQVQYAKKIARMIGSFVLEEVNEKLCNTLFYI